MRLRDLDASFVGEAKEGSFRHLDSVEGAQGIMFQCPKCAQGLEVFEEHGSRGVRGAHYVLCWFKNPRNAPPVGDEVSPKPGRWTFTGDTIDDITFTGPGAFSVQLMGGGCNWHGYVANGDAT
jgi:hypothetical protein